MPWGCERRMLRSMHPARFLTIALVLAARPSHLALSEAHMKAAVYLEEVRDYPGYPVLLGPCVRGYRTPTVVHCRVPLMPGLVLTVRKSSVFDSYQWALSAI